MEGLLPTEQAVLHLQLARATSRAPAVAAHRIPIGPLVSVPVDVAVPVAAADEQQAGPAPTAAAAWRVPGGHTTLCAGEALVQQRRQGLSL